MKCSKCFISYSSDEEEYIKNWVKKLASKLSQENIDVIIDQGDLKYGQDLPNFMETSIRESDFVLLVCTPSFALKSDNGEGGVGYEKMIITGEIFQGISAPEKFIPILREGNKENAIPSYLKSKTYIDFGSVAKVL